MGGFLYTNNMKKLLFLLLFLFPVLLSAHTLKGKIVRVSDGDTVVLLDSNNKQHKIRLDGIDAPEKGQAYGNKSKEYLSSLIAGKTVIVEYEKKDMYKRILGTIFYQGKNINEEMVRSGYAWTYYYNKSKRMLELQDNAKKGNKGLWKDKNPINPYHYRKNKNNKK